MEEVKLKMVLDCIILAMKIKDSNQRELEVNFQSDLTEDEMTYVIQGLRGRNFVAMMLQPYLLKVFW